jgi:hypothetical protein
MVILHDDGCTASDERIVLMRLSSAPFAGKRAALVETRRATEPRGMNNRRALLTSTVVLPIRFSGTGAWLLGPNGAAHTLLDGKVDVYDSQGKPILFSPAIANSLGQAKAAGGWGHDLPSSAAALRLSTVVGTNGTSVARSPNSP